MVQWRGTTNRKLAERGILGAGHLSGIPLLFKGPQLCVSLLSRWSEAMFVSCISYFSFRTECTLGLLSNLSLLYASALFCLLLLSLSLSHHCDHNTMTTSCCSSLIPLSHWTTNLGNTWIDCQPARVVKATLKLQLWKLVKIRTLSTAGTQCWVPFLDLHTCQDEENKRWGQGSQRRWNLKTWGAAIKKHSNKWNDFKDQPFHYSQK